MPVEHEKETWQVNIHCNNKLTDLSMQGGEVVSVGIRLVCGKSSGAKMRDEVILVCACFQCLCYVSNKGLERGGYHCQSIASVFFFFLVHLTAVH